MVYGCFCLQLGLAQGLPCSRVVDLQQVTCSSSSGTKTGRVDAILHIHVHCYRIACMGHPIGLQNKCGDIAPLKQLEGCIRGAFNTVHHAQV